MARIESLEIVGFKSFCEATNILFNGDITAIVGPNGCGKSNIADAIGWVMGEQSARSLRAERMEDVIFNGSERRRPIGLAEVTLRLSGVGRNGIKLEMPEGAEEVVISRRLYRSGESEYFINGERCRLRDIREAFEGTGLGAISYAIIEQGRIEQLIAAKPQERRALIEEAARIASFKGKRKAAELKLEAARQNLARVNDIIFEVERQLAALRRQAARARRYYRLQEELRFFLEVKMLNDYRRLTCELERCRRALEHAAERERSLASNLASLEEERRRALAALSELERATDAARARLASLSKELDNALALRNFQSAEARDLGSRLEALRRLEEQLEEKYEWSKYDLQEAQKLLRQHELEMDCRSERIRLWESEEARLSEQFDRLQAECESLQRAGRDEFEKLAALRSERLALEAIIEQGGRRISQLEEQRSKLLLEVEEAGRRSEQSAQALARHQEAREKAASEYRHEELRRQALARGEDQQQAELRAREGELFELESRLAALAQLAAQLRLTSAGALDSTAAEKLGVRGTLADFLELDPRFHELIPAIDRFLACQLNYLVVDDLDHLIRTAAADPSLAEAIRGFSFLALRPYGRCPDRQPPKRREALHRSEGFIGYLYDLINDSGEIRAKEALFRAMPELAQVAVVVDMEAAALAAENGRCFLTSKGEFFAPCGLLTVPSRNRHAAELQSEHLAGTGPLGLKKAKRELEAKVARQRELVAAARMAVEELARQREESAARCEQLLSDLRRIELETERLRALYEKYSAELAEKKQAADLLASERDSLAAQLQALETKAEGIDAAISAMSCEGRSREAELEAARKRLAEVGAAAEKAKSELSKLRIEDAAARERKRALLAEIERLDRYCREEEERLAAARSEAEAVGRRLAELEKAEGELALKIERELAEKGTAERELASLVGRVEKTRQDIAAMEAELEARRVEHKRALEEKSGCEVELARFENDLSHLRLRVREQFDLGLEEFISGLGEEQLAYPADQAAENYQKLKERLENFGPINMRALDEYKELEQRHSFLLAQRQDVEASIASTQQAIAEINQRSIEQFGQAFAAINENFKRLFQVLFGGGHCEMRLLDESDPLESGIEIIAQPPGKRLQNMLLLSGGEKALVALALLLAIFKYRPSPFCVLDEVDAPLDDANIERFTRLLREMSQHTQFILITHNKKTMEMAQSLYGVTMEEPGVSKIVSVRMRS